jgi:hypothetical protein
MSSSRKAALAAVVILVLVGGVLAARRAAAETILVPMLSGEARLHFDPRRISVERLLELALLSPNVSWTFPPEGWEGPDLPDAEADLHEVEGMLADVARLQAPPQLDAVLAHVRREAEFHLCLRRAQLEYYRGDDYALWAPCEEIEPAVACAGAAAEAPLTRAAAARHRLAGNAWRDCMGAAFRRRHGAYPLADWEAFRATYGIDEEVGGGC